MQGGENNVKDAQKNGEKDNSPHTMSHLNAIGGETGAQNISLLGLAAQLTKSQREKLISGCDIKKLAKIFEDKDIMNTVDGFLNNGMNVSAAARALYMHRNTLNYRLNTIRKAAGLDLRSFDDAITFKILHILYLMK